MEGYELTRVTLGLPYYLPCGSKEAFSTMIDALDRSIKTSNELGQHLARRDENRYPFQVLLNVSD